MTSRCSPISGDYLEESAVTQDTFSYLPWEPAAFNEEFKGAVSSTSTQTLSFLSQTIPIEDPTSGVFTETGFTLRIGRDRNDWECRFR